MTDKTYGMMNWRDVEGIIYADVTNPHEILGLKNVKGGTLIQVFAPDAEKAEVIFQDTSYKLTCQDESGFFALFVRKKLSGIYKIKTTYKDGSTNTSYDPYEFPATFDRKALDKFAAGINYEIFNYLGAHREKVNGVEGVRFAVWAPEAVRVSVVGDFNFWDGRRNIMTKDAASGVFEIFIPEIKEGDIYKYEIRKKGGDIILKADPYGFEGQVRPETASVVYDIDNYKWKDSKWLTGRKKVNTAKSAMSVYEIHAGSWKKNPDGEFYNFRELAPMITEYVKSMGYTHVELMPVMDHMDDYSFGYMTTGYYAPTSRYGTPEDFMYFVDYLHQNNIGVILDWVPAYFPKNEEFLGRFDGSGLYEHIDPRKGEYKGWNAYAFNYGRPQVSNFLIANALFWVEKYHADGIRLNGVASMLYLDYDRDDGQWIPNIYGGRENLEAVEFLKHLNSIMKKRNSSVMMIAEETSGWPQVTGDVENGESLGFDLKWNTNWSYDFIQYMKCLPMDRKNLYNDLTLSMVYNYSENYLLPLSHDNTSLLEKMPGNEEEKFANLRAAYGFLMAHPGKKLIFMGQDFGQKAPWNVGEALDWSSVENKLHEGIQRFLKDLNNIYTSEPALYELDNSSEGFSWINCISQEKSILVFMRQAVNHDELIIAVCNFDNVSYKNYRIGVPVAGKYKEIINSDNTAYGGTGITNPRIKTSALKECDGLKNSISINVPPVSISLFKYKKGEN